MIGASIAMAAMAVFFVVFGLFGLADGKGCDGHCAGCVGDCDNDFEGRVP